MKRLLAACTVAAMAWLGTASADTVTYEGADGALSASVELTTTGPASRWWGLVREGQIEVVVTVGEQAFVLREAIRATYWGTSTDPYAFQLDQEQGRIVMELRGTGDVATQTVQSMVLQYAAALAAPATLGNVLAWMTETPLVSVGLEARNGEAFDVVIGAVPPTPVPLPGGAILFASALASAARLRRAAA